MKVTVRLYLPKLNNKLTLKFNTFEKVSYDKYFIASLIKNSDNSLQVYDLIDEVTGKGSLNAHFKNIYDELKEISKYEIEKILKDSLYPMLKIQEYRYQYIPILNLSLFQGNVIEGDIAKDDYFARTLVDKNGTYVNHVYEKSEPIAKAEAYKVNLDDDKIEIEFSNNYYSISQVDFQNIVERDQIDLNSYLGIIHKTMEGNNWIQLSKLTYNNIMNSKDYFYENGNHFAINNDFVKESKIAYNWALFWVKEKSYRYSDPSNKNICEKVARALMDSGKINEFKTKSLNDILKNINRDLQQEIINYILNRKDSKELALIGLVLIDKGYEKGWSEEAFMSFYKFRENSKQLLNLYRINHGFEYSIEDLIEIYKNDKTLLKTNHLSQVNEYYGDCDKIRKSMEEKVGEISLSGIRENYGKMPLDEDTKKFRKYINEIMAHFDKDIKNKNLEQLIQFEKKVNDFYELYKVVLKKWEFFKLEF